ncbi:unnamed protein product [Symbiodinium pilosum]|uniref:Sulfotransferase domain-containing protein n=1 Tax=Symbiodinium pilosum TaxID=2952 RepID=A0A812WYS6_SYMPI|nr:unnamed protein product [Symbiodinium pilosum]
MGGHEGGAPRTISTSTLSTDVVALAFNHPSNLRKRHRLGFDEPTLHNIWDSMSQAFAGDNLHGLVWHWLYPEYAAVGVSRQHAQNLTRRALAFYHGIYGELGKRFVLPRHLCLTCCQLGAGRLRIMVVRNPFERLVSFFRLKWLGSQAKVSNRWADFPTYVRYVSEIFNYTDAYQTLPDFFQHGKRMPNSVQEFEQNDLLHTRAVAEWLASAQPRPLKAKDFLQIQVEQLNSGMVELARQLCETLGYCRPLPIIPKVNSFSKPISPRIWAGCWRGGVALQAVHRYKLDFQDLGIMHSVRPKIFPRGASHLRGVGMLSVRLKDSQGHPIRFESRKKTAMAVTCGVSLGAFFVIAAAAFWLMGLLFGWNGPDTHFQEGLTYHAFNMFWFYLGFATAIFGGVYAAYARGSKAFAREPQDVQEEEPKDKSAPEAAPTPYVMLPAEP